MKDAQTESCLKPMANPEVWRLFIANYTEKNNYRKRKIECFNNLMPEVPQMSADILAGQYNTRQPKRLTISKMDGRRKRLVYVYPPADELVMKISTRLLSVYDHLLPDTCHAFRPRHSARQAFHALLRNREIDQLACIRVDITDYFNSIAPERALVALPAEIQADEPLMALLRRFLLEGDYTENGREVKASATGIKPGTPLAPILANYYLAELDRHFCGRGFAYARYSDDIIIFVPPQEQQAVFAELRQLLADLGLALNDKKTCLQGPGERWEYLGFSYDRGRIDLSDAALQKLKNRTRRLARRLNRYRVRKQVPSDKILYFFFRRLNGRLYGYSGRPTKFCWARWYMPVINTSDSLLKLDRYIQEAARYACTGRYQRANYRLISREMLARAGCRPLVPYFYAREWREDTQKQPELANPILIDR